MTESMPSNLGSYSYSPLLNAINKHNFLSQQNLCIHEGEDFDVMAGLFNQMLNNANMKFNEKTEESFLSENTENKFLNKSFGPPFGMKIEGIDLDSLDFSQIQNINT